ncbi:hypothetical protein PTKIN_Ptkin02bG0253900 [Pterospermum kingtungense]
MLLKQIKARTEHVVVLQNRFEIEGNGTNHDQTHHRQHWIYTLQAKCNFGAQLAVINFVMEIPSAVMDQMASDHKPGCVLTVMLLSLATMLLCSVELVCIGIKEKITWRWNNGGIPWFYHPAPSNKPSVN